MKLPEWQYANRYGLCRQTKTMPTLLYIPTIFGISIVVYFILIALAIPAFFIWRWVFRRSIKARKTRKIATWSATVIATPIIYVGIVMLWLFSISYYPQNNFSKEQWRSNRQKRYEISENLIESKLLIGKTKPEVRKILGETENDESNKWFYYLGLKPGFANIDPDVLVIKFKDGKVIKVEQHGT